MKTLLIILALLFVSCQKENYELKHCWECETSIVIDNNFPIHSTYEKCNMTWGEAIDFQKNNTFTMPNGYTSTKCKQK